MLFANVKLESIITIDRLERRDMEDFLSAHDVFGCDGRQIIFVAQVAVSLAEGIADLRNHHPQRVLRIHAEPEAHWIEHVAE